MGLASALALSALAALIPTSALADRDVAAGSISGRVTEEGGALLELACIMLYDADDDTWTGHQTWTDASGAYRLENIEAGPYKVEFQDCDQRFDHEIEWYNDEPTWEQADVVNVTAGVNFPGIDASLRPITSTTVILSSGGNGHGHVVSDPPGIDCQPACEAQFPWDTVVKLTATPDERSEFRHWTGCDEVQGTTCLITTDHVQTHVWPNYEILDSVPPETGIDLGPESPSMYRDATFRFWTDKPVEGWWECSLDGSAWEPCSYPLHYHDLADGSHTFRVRSVDRFGQRDPTPAEWAWTIHADPPETTIHSAPPEITTSSQATFTFASNKDSTFECSLNNGSFTSCKSPYATTLAEGSYRFRVRATDKVGRADPTPATHDWIVDTRGPEMIFLRPTEGLYVNDQPMGGAGPIVVVGSVRVDLVARDLQSGISAFAFSVNGTAVDPAQVKVEGDVYSFVFRPALPGLHTISVQATNGSGLSTSESLQVVGVPTAP